MGDEETREKLDYSFRLFNPQDNPTFVEIFLMISSKEELVKIILENIDLETLLNALPNHYEKDRLEKLALEAMKQIQQLKAARASSEFQRLQRAREAAQGLGENQLSILRWLWEEAQIGKSLEDGKGRATYSSSDYVFWQISKVLGREANASERASYSRAARLLEKRGLIKRRVHDNVRLTALGRDVMMVLT